MDQFLDKDGLTYTRTAEEPDLTAFCIRSDEVDDFDAGFKNFGCRRLVFKGRCR